MSQIWANYLLQDTVASVVPSAGWVNVGDVLQWRGGGPRSTVLAVIPAPDGAADPIQQSNPGDQLTIAPYGTQAAATILSGELVNFLWIS